MKMKREHPGRFNFAIYVNGQSSSLLLIFKRIVKSKNAKIYQRIEIEFSDKHLN